MERVAPMFETVNNELKNYSAIIENLDRIIAFDFSQISSLLFLFPHMYCVLPMCDLYALSLMTALVSHEVA